MLAGGALFILCRRNNSAQTLDGSARSNESHMIYILETFKIGPLQKIEPSLMFRENRKIEKKSDKNDRNQLFTLYNWL
jgi:hypothetical protein